jgi:hypothetical protein
VQVPRGPGRGGAETKLIERGVVARLVPWVAVVVAALLLLLLGGTPAVLVARFAAYWVGWIAVPGVLVWRVLAPSWQRPFDVLVLGVCFGYALELVSFIGAALAGLRWLYWAHPFVVILVALLAARRAPPRRTPEPYDRRGALWHWGTAAVAVAVLLGTAVYYYLGTPWPVLRPASLSVDLYYQLGWAADATRAMPPTDPAVSGVQQPYEWFTYAHLAAAHQISGVSLPWLLFRFYLVPPLLLYAGVLASAACRLARRPWAGPYAAAVVPLLSELNLSQYKGWLALGGFKDWSFYSPTWVYGLVFLTPLLLLLPDQFTAERRGRRWWGRWAAVALLAAAAAGGKTSLLPVLACGCLAAVVFAAVWDRARLSATAIAAGVVLAVLAASIPVLYSTGGGRLSVGFGIPWFVTTRYSIYLRRLFVSDAVLPWAAVGTAVSLFALGAGYTGAVVMVKRNERRVAQVFLVGCFVAGYLAKAWVQDPAASQHWFLLTGCVALAVLAGWGVAALAEPLRAGIAAAVGVAGALIGLLGTLALVRQYTSYRDPVPDPARILDMLAIFVIGAVVVTAAAGAIVRRRRRTTSGLAFVAVLAGGALASTATYYIEPLHSYLRTGQAVLPEDSVTRSSRNRPDLTPALLSALDWVRRNSSTFDVLAVNNTCLVRGPTGTCTDHRVFYYSAFTERRVLIESWSYSQPTLNEAVRTKASYVTLPSPYPERTRLNTALFTDPSPSALAEAYQQYGVRWLLVDLRYGRPPSALDADAVLAYRTADAVVYRLRPPG